MKHRTITIIQNIALFVGLCGITARSHALQTQEMIPHQMQHGFILAADDTFASHLVATGHHSQQTEIIGQLTIADAQEKEFYSQRKLQSRGQTYFLFQAQHLNLPTLAAGQVLSGHIIESRLGAYEPKNTIVRAATFKVHRVLLNIPNPFFKGEEKLSSSFQATPTKSHCCDTGARPCNWKC